MATEAAFALSDAVTDGTTAGSDVTVADSFDATPVTASLVGVVVISTEVVAVTADADVAFVGGEVVTSYVLVLWTTSFTVVT